jgi:hypothetical protein
LSVKVIDLGFQSFFLAVMAMRIIMIAAIIKTAPLISGIVGVGE